MILNDQQFQKLKQGFQGGVKSLGVMADQAFQGLRKTVSEASKRGLIGLGGVNALAKQAEPVLNPGSTFLSPALEKRGVNPIVAGTLGFGADILAPGPGELGKAEDVVQLGRKILSKLGTDNPSQFSSMLDKFKLITGLEKTIDAAKNPKELSDIIENFIQKEHTVTDKVLSSFKKEPLKPSSPLAQGIDERLAPLADKDGMVTVYRASNKFPSDKLPKDTYVATNSDNARYYAESHYKGNPSDITVRPFKIPASQLKRGGSSDAWQLKEDFNLMSKSPTLAQEVGKYKTAEEFVKYHKTGDIKSGTYDDSLKTFAEDNILKKENNPKVVGKIGKFELRETGEPLQYAKTDNRGEIVRKGRDVVYMTPDEMKAKGLQEFDSTIVAYDGDQPVGYVMDSFGSPEIVIAKPYQGKGIGSGLLERWLSKFKPGKKIGQMTPEGEKMVRSMFNKLKNK